MMFRTLLFLFATTLPVIASRPALSGPVGIFCSDVLGNLEPCMKLIKESYTNPGPICCRPLKGLGEQFALDKIVVCGCIKDGLIKKIGPYNASILPILLGKCGIKTTFPPIDQKYDCKKMPPFHISDSNDKPRHEKHDGLIHAGIKANYIHKITASGNYKNILDVPMDVEHDGMAHDGMVSGMVSENHRYIQGVPMTEEKNMMAHKRMVSENIQHVPMSEEHDRMVAKGTVSENYKDIKHVHMIEEHDRMVPEDTISRNYKYIEDVPMTEELESTLMMV